MTNSISKVNFPRITKALISMTILTAASIAAPFFLAAIWNISNLESKWHLSLIPIAMIIYVLLSLNAIYYIEKYKKMPHNTKTFKGSAFYTWFTIGVIGGLVVGAIEGLYLGAVTGEFVIGIIWGPIVGTILGLMTGLGIGLSTELSTKENL